MSHALEEYSVVGTFRCLGADCPDTCCHGWDMPSDAGQRAMCTAKQPALLQAIDPEQQILKRDPASGDCAQLCEGKCRIHADYGAAFLSDACYFYPRVVQRIDGVHRLAGDVSCPEMLRLILTEAEPFALKETTNERSPQRRHDLAEGQDGATTREVMQAALAIAQDASLTPELILLQLLKLAERMEGQEHAVAAEVKTSDAHAIYYALMLTEAFGAPGISRRLPAIAAVMAKALDCTFDRTTRELRFGANAGQAYGTLHARWQIGAEAALAPVLRRWIQAQLTMSAFPYGGFRECSITERAAILVQRFATIRLALMCHVGEDGAAPDEATVIFVIQGIARFMDHLADSELTRMIHRDSGWQSPARLRGLIAG